MPSDAREELLRYLDHNAFDPVVDADPDDFRPEEREMLEDVRRAADSTKRRYHEAFRSAEELRDGYRRDVRADAHRAIRGELRQLGLPTLPDVRKGFEKLADRLGVGT
ncbi:MAG: hypothetical protein IBX62_03745 [Coriobacteriia bacterium]|nr:hypothetical protein [Coriobacteriia bacterium]